MRSDRVPCLGGRAAQLSDAPARGRASVVGGWTFFAGRGIQRTLDVVLVAPDVVLEVAVDVVRDQAGRWRNPVRPHRIRAEMHPMQVPKAGEPEC
ncbi:hypothetical protein GCM10010145_59420 [Streptomyces ruber]|uniref:Uncharacterized protein n=2 Tax=Streptomyces TaxID=1883 RepID=A0A918BPN1_9ACTN|nr:hypothetical protein GCM10010145_59420 [Streptomyces ruber]